MTTADDRPRVFLDARCTRCADNHAYRMVGRCRNCGAEVLVMLTAGHDAGRIWKACPACGCHDTVETSRLATENEIPSAFNG